MAKKNRLIKQGQRCGTMACGRPASHVTYKKMGGLRIYMCQSCNRAYKAGILSELNKRRNKVRSETKKMKGSDGHEL